MLDKKTKIYSREHEVNMKGVYENAQERMAHDLKRVKSRYKNVRVDKISFALFSKVVIMYFGLLLVEIIKNGTDIKMYQRFGYWLVVKTKCNRYTPKRYFFIKKEGKVIREERKIKIYGNTNGFVPFVFWDAPAKWRHYRLRMAIKWKRILYKEYITGSDYLDYTMVKKGRNASKTYIYA